MTLAGTAGRVLLNEEELAEAVRRLGAQISKDHPDGIVLVGILKGSLCLVADLARQLTVPCSIDFLALSAYVPGGARVKVSKDIDIDLSGRDAVIAVDIVDHGLTVSYVQRLLAERGATSTDICALVDRKKHRLFPIEVRYLGVEIGDEYLIGYGLGFEDQYRNLPVLMATSPQSLRSGLETPPSASAKTHPQG